MSEAERHSLPRLIQGGMGVAVSSWRLARVVAARGQLGVVSGTAIERVIACRLQDGDPGGHIRRTALRFPFPAIAERALKAWFRPDGLAKPGAYRLVPFFTHEPGLDLLELTVFAAFIEVALAKEGHQGEIGINLLEKIHAPTLPTLYGAMLAGVDWVLMGAGIPKEIPGHLARLARHESSTLRIPCVGGEDLLAEFDPSRLGALQQACRLPRVLAIVSSDVLAASLARAGGFDGVVIEGPLAGGHNAPPRGAGGHPVPSPVYGDRDRVNLARLRTLGLPFWLAGGQASHEALAEAQAQGAVGIQVGTAFAFSDESGIEPELKRRVLEAVRAGTISVVTDGLASPTGYPFKVVPLPGTEGGRPASVRTRRPCILGGLRHAARMPDGRIVWRCPAESEQAWLAKGGDPEEQKDRRCVCQGLIATAGHTQGEEELPLITAGDDLLALDRFLTSERDGYSADQVLDSLLGPVEG